MNVEAIAAVTEGKITRAELVELAIDSMRKKLVEQRDALNAELSALRAVSITVKDAIRLLKAASPSVQLTKRTESTYNHLTHRYDYRHIGFKLTLTADLPLDAAVPAHWLKATQRYDELKPQRQEVEQQLSKLSGGAKQARVELIKQALEQSPAGQKVLAAIETLRADVHSKLLGTGAAK